MKKFLNVFKNYFVLLSILIILTLMALTFFTVRYIRLEKLKEIALTPPPQYVNMQKEEDNKSTVKEVTKNIKTVPEKKVKEARKEEPEKEEKFEIIKPVKGKIINRFSGEELVYSKTFNDFRTHNGIDITGKRLTPVTAVYDGVIEDIYADALYGIVIVINHNNSYKTIYKNLSSDKMVRKGDTVKKEQVISGIGETGIFEANEESHVHFELLKDGKYINPEDYFIN